MSRGKKKRPGGGKKRTGEVRKVARKVLQTEKSLNANSEKVVGGGG